VGYRFGKYLSDATSLVVSYCEAAKEREGDDELREHCLQVRRPGRCCCACTCTICVPVFVYARVHLLLYDELREHCLQSRKPSGRVCVCVCVCVFVHACMFLRVKGVIDAVHVEDRWPSIVPK